MISKFFSIQVYFLEKYDLSDLDFQNLFPDW